MGGAESGRGTDRVGDEADGVHDHVAGHGERVDPVQRNFVLVLQQVRAVYCHLEVTTGNYTVPQFKCSTLYANPKSILTITLIICGTDKYAYKCTSKCTNKYV